MREYITHSEQETAQAAAEIAQRLHAGDIILYKGEMGAGKTAFTKGIAKQLGITEPVTSPTFALVNEYEGRLPLFHFDLYRIDSYDDLYAIGFFDYLDRGGIIAAEWSENIEGLSEELENVISITIDKLGENDRKITVCGGVFDEEA
ncbi:MAG: tRNA (adenosine(37)-N6)-threonylcarbamoyltransferase complex ATPase subunit type 1 TsaE [Oscillospiraceae bacterium]